MAKGTMRLDTVPRAEPGKLYPYWDVGLNVFLRFSRFRFKEGREQEGRAILQRHTATIASCEGCRDAWLAQGQHPSTEFVVIALFESEETLRSLEGRIRSDPSLGGDFFDLLRLTTQPPEVTQYEVLSRR